MADDKDPFAEFGGTAVADADPFKAFGGSAVKKKADTSESPTGSASSQNGSIPFLNTPQNTDLTPVLPQYKEEIRQRQQDQQAILSKHLKSIQNGLDPEHQKLFQQAQEITTAKNPDELSEVSQKDIDHYNFMQTPLGKTLGGIAYLGSKATKGTLQVAKGAAYLADMAASPQHLITGEQDENVKKAFDKADENTNFGLTKGDQQRMSDNPVMSNLGGLAEFLPSAAAAGSTGGATFYLQGLGQGKDAMDAVEKSGAKINPLVKNAFILGTGAVNGVLMGDLGGSMFKALPAGLRGDISASITANAIKEAAGKEITGDEFKNLLGKGAKEFTDKLQQGGIKGLEGYKHAVTNLAGLTTANFALKKGVDIANDKPVFNESMGDLASNLNDVATKQAPFFAIPAAIGAATKLTKYSDYKNSVVESLMQDSKPENVEKLKSDIAQYGEQNGWKPEETEATVQHVDQLAQITKSLPKNLPENKVSEAVDLVQGRNDLQKELATEQEGRKQLDPSMQDIVSQNEQMLIDKIDQANDKLKDIATGSKTTYSKGIAEEEGKFFKTINGKKEEIEESRYDLEKLERPVPKDETTQTINNQENESTNEKNGEESSSQGGSEESSTKSEGGSQESDAVDGKEGNVDKSGESAAEPEIIEHPKELNDTDPATETPIENTKLASNDKIINVKGRELIYHGKPNEEGYYFTDKETGKGAYTWREVNKYGKPNKNNYEELINTVVNDFLKTEYGKNESVFSEKSNLNDKQITTETGGDNRAVEGVAEPIQPPQNDQTASRTQSSGGEAAQGSEPTGIRNADVEAERGEAVGRTHKTKPEIDLEGKRRVDEDSQYSDDTAKDIIAKTRPITAEEEAALTYRKVQIKKEKRAILSDENPENTTENQIKLAKLQDEFDRNLLATETGGNELGRGLGYRTETMNEDFSRNSVFRRAKLANNGEELSDKDKAVLEGHTKRIEDLENELSDREEQIKKLNDDLLTKKIGESQRQSRKDVTRQKLREEREGLLAELHLIARKSMSSAGVNKIPLDMIEPLTKLAVNYVADGINTLSIVVDKVYNDLKDHIEGLKKEDVEEVIKGGFDKYVFEENKKRLLSAKKRQQTKLSDIQNQLETGNYDKKVQRKIQVDNDYLKIRAEINRQQLLINKKIAEIGYNQKSVGRKAVDFAVKYGRQAKLASVTVLGKLAATGLTTMALKPVTEATGAIYSKLLPNIAKKSLVEGGIDIKGLANSYAKAATVGMKDAYDELNIKRGGQSDLSALYGKYTATRLPAEAADFFGHLHSAIKAPIKRQAWEYSYAKRIAKGIEAGIDVQDPIIDAKNRLDAYKDGERAIFMGDNVISKAYEASMKTLENSSSSSAQNIAALTRILLPFVKVPTNIALSAGRYSFGLVPGLSKLAQIGTSDALKKVGAEKLATLIHKGMGELTPEESDMVLRNLKHGSVGGAALLIGFYNPKNVGGFYQEHEKRKKNDANAGAFKVFDTKIPEFLTENPIFLAMQVGATFRRVLDAHRHKDDNVGAATLATASGLAEHIPLANEAKQVTDLFGADTKKGYHFLSQLVKGEIEPAAIQQLATITDTKNGDLFSLKEKNQQKRNPDKKHGLLKYLKQDLSTGVPILRKTVPKK